VNAARTLGPVDGVLLETCSTRRVARAIAKLQAECRGLPILLSMTFLKDDDGAIRTIDGLAPEWFAEQAQSWGLAALGVNCGLNLDMAAIAEVIRRYRTVSKLPLVARPNAGTPRKVGRRYVYPRTPVAMAKQLPPLLEAGIAMVGGCCGTTPQHIAAMQPVVAQWNRS
jgi:methionine synthase I (cobalamin-dependent)